ncbi:Protein FAM210B [Carex littledalei]|uniref:Protein FAM210B n=1 Tax=Carex littledalei TaxID=544730 RepID=A0A833QT86_9POAL|nr:Protein FAM210B [Carex littledalei]
MAFRARMKELMKKYGKVAIGVHLSVSTVSITGLYVAIKNNVDVESIFERIGLSARVEPDKVESTDRTDTLGEDHPATPPSTTNRTAAMVASSGGVLALAVLCNKALFPVRVPITIALTPPIARYLAKRNLLKT